MMKNRTMMMIMMMMTTRTLTWSLLQN